MVHITPEQLPTYMILTATTARGANNAWTTDIVHGWVPDNHANPTTGTYMPQAMGSTLEIKRLGA